MNHRKTCSNLLATLLLGIGLAQAALAQTPDISLGNASALEGNAGTTTLNVPVTRTGDTVGNIGLRFQTNASPVNPATAGADYVAVPAGNAVLPAGASSVNLPISVTGDTAIEPDEQFLVHLLSAHNAGPTPNFGEVSQFTTGINSRAAAMADFNGDGRQDLAVVSQTVGLAVLLNTTAPGATSPSFASAQIFVVANSPFSVAAGDINGDGLPDVAVANTNNANVSVLLNTTAPGATSASFATAQNFGVGFGPISVALGDLNGDGRLDMAVVNNNNHNVSVRLNTTTPGATSPSFAAALIFSVGSRPISVAVADLNSDGRLDLAVANSESDSVSVLLNTASPGAAVPSFAGAQHFNVGSRPRSVAVGDLNGDGQPDLAVANELSTNVSVLLNVTALPASSVSFAHARNFGVSGASAPYSVAMTDLNGDGRPDLAVANAGSGSVSILLNTSAPGANSPAFANARNFGTGVTPEFVTTGDLNGDGLPDLALALQATGKVSVLLNTTLVSGNRASFAAQASFDTGNGPNSLALGDVNGDGRPDLAVANLTGANVSVLLNSASPGTDSASFASQAIFGTATITASVAFGDLNGDGRPDLVAANSGSDAVSVLFNTTAAGASSASFTHQALFDTESNPVSVALGDVNGDGLPDMLVANRFSDTVSVLLNTTEPGAATASFAAQTAFGTGSNPISVALGDVNGDGRPDLVVAENGTNNVSVLLNTTAPGAATASFAAQTSFSTGLLPVSVVLSDVNGDGRPDLAVANSGSGSVSVLLNTTAPGAASASFADQIAFEVGALPFSVALGDVNGDGRPDLGVANGGSTSVSILLNTTAPGAATASFAAQTGYGAGSTPSSVALGDVNGDGRSDLVVANFNSNNVSVLLNRLYPVTVSGNEATATIENDDQPSVTFVLAGQSVSEGVGSVVVTVNLSNASHQSISLPFTVTGTAGAGDRSVTTTSPLSFAPGETSKTITVSITDDGLDEADETVVLTLSAPGNASLGGITVHTLTIRDNDDPPTVSLSANPASIAEALGVSTVTATLSGPSSFPVTVTLGFAGTAGASDYNTSGSVITIPAGSTSGSVTVTATQDALDENNETVIASIASAGNATPAGGSVTVTIVDDDAAPTVAFTLSAQSVGEATASLTVNVTLSAASGLPVTVPLNFAGTAVFPADYGRSATSISIPAGSTGGSITLTPVNDTAFEAPNETVLVSLGAVTNATAGTPGSQTVTIVDNDATAVATLTLAPADATALTLTQHCVTATTRDSVGTALPGIAVAFSVTGVNPGGGTVNTTAAGTAQHCFNGSNGGIDTIKASFTGTLGLKQATAKITWNKRVTLLDVQPVAAVLVGSGLNARIELQPRAQIRDSASGQPIAGKTIRFKAGIRTLCSAVTDAQGTATCPASLSKTLAGVLRGGYTGDFTGDSSYRPSTDTGEVLNITVLLGG